MRDLDVLLEKTSRTFALSIPRLPDPTRREVTIAYLLFRIADTFEDASDSPPEARRAALDDLERLLADDESTDAVEASRRWLRDIRVEHDGYRELLEKTAFVLRCFRELRPGARQTLREHLRRTCRGMAEFVARSAEKGEVRLDDVDELRAYCYVVAGIVGEMLTELFILGRASLEPVASRLRDRAVDFGEGLQLVNVLKDAAVDAEEGRRYLPEGVERSEVFALARNDLERASEYVLALQEADAPPGIVAFCALPVKLAWATLRVVEERGPGAKISRSRVWELVEELETALTRGEPAVAAAEVRRGVG